MAVRKIRRYPQHEARLRKKCTPVKQIDQTVQRLIADLKETMQEAGGIGMAAPQVGVPQRICVVYLNADKDESGPTIALINPEKLAEGPLARDYDGCLSIPGLQGYTRRPEMIRIRALNEAGETVEYTFTGLDARIAHHELDHLDGILYIDRLDTLEDLFYIEEDEKGEVVFIPYLDVHPELLVTPWREGPLPIAAERVP